MKIINFVFFVLNSKCIFAWDTKQLEVFDVVEEVKLNFYEFLTVPQDADVQTIKTAFRRLSLELHPDKNPAENADEQFRHLVSIYDVLKDSTKRKYYDEVLINGLPNWRSAVYYYRHVRRIGLLELCLFLFVLISIGQYLVGWASYFERRYTLEQMKGRKQKKAVVIIDIEKPSLFNTLPFQVPRVVWYSILQIPWLFSLLKEKTLEKLEERHIEAAIDEDQTYEIKTVRKRKPGFVIPDGPTFESSYSKEGEDQKDEVSTNNEVAPVAGGLWTDDDLSELVRLINRFPGGTSKRWEVIAENLGRSVAEITYMVNKMKNNSFRLPSTESEPTEAIRVKKKKKGEKLEELISQNRSVWSQEQQKAMENALSRFSKGAVDRWDCIAECVPGKTKEECIIRYKYLVELVKKQKQTEEQETPENET